MNTKQFTNSLDNDKIVAAIGGAELKTSGEIRVFVSNRGVEDPVLAAQEQFSRLNMERTAERNAVLIFIAPRAQKFAVIGDTAIHEKCGPDFWTQLADRMTTHFRSGDYTAGVLAGIHQASEILAQHFPRRADDKNELPNAIEAD